MISTDKVSRAKNILRLAAEMSAKYYNRPLTVCYSGGKDSDVLVHLCGQELQPSEYMVLNSHTTVDAPETVRHIRSVFASLQDRGVHCEIQMPTFQGERTSMWKLIEKKKIPPTRILRYCCAVLKEASTPNQVVALGVREQESSRRKGRDAFGVRSKEKQFYSYEHTKEVYEEAQERDEIWDCQLITAAKSNKDLLVNPIYDFTNADIWDYLRKNDIKTNPLYECGFDRVGCVLCPMGTFKKRTREAAMYPKYATAYTRAFDRMILARKESGLETQWNTGEECFDWWIGTDQIAGQMELDL